VAKGTRAWTLNADYAEIQDADSYAKLTNPAIDCSQENSSSTITALRGQFDFEKRNATLEDTVVAFFHKDRVKLETSKLYYSPPKSYAWTNQKVKLTRDNAAGEPLFGVKSDTAPAVGVAAQEKSSTTVTASRGQFYLDKRNATLEGTVVALAHRDGVKLETEKLYYAPGTLWSDVNVKITRNPPLQDAAPKASPSNAQPAVITASRGRFDIEQKSATLEGDVVAQSETDHKRLETQLLHYSLPRALIWTDEAVKITQDGTIVRGRGFEAKPDMSEITVRQQETQISGQ
jgi:lipopolysaccharide export system protein LptC